MPIYPPRSQPIRKKEILTKKINEFLKYLKSDCSDEKLLNKAEKVRNAKLNLLKAQINSLSSYREEDDNDLKAGLLTKYLREKLAWEEKTIEEIKEHYL